jgi:hypothetical protein
MDNIILENGYNTDYLYSLLISLFHNPSSSSYNIINTDTKNSNTYYIQEFIKYYFGSIISKNASIETNIVCRLRLFLYNCGWLKQNSINIVERANINNFYKFLIYEMLEYSINILKIDKKTNKSTNFIFDVIHITRDNIKNNKDNKALLTSLVDDWIDKKIGNYNYKFENIPFLIPIYIDIRDPYTKLNTKYINIMEGFSFKNICDNLQKTIIWDINSIICQTSNGFYYTLINYNSEWIGFSDSRIPSNWKVDMSDVLIVKKIMKEVVMVFYKL